MCDSSLSIEFAFAIILYKFENPPEARLTALAGRKSMKTVKYPAKNKTMMMRKKRRERKKPKSRRVSEASNLLESHLTAQQLPRRRLEL